MFCFILKCDTCKLLNVGNQFKFKTHWDKNRQLNKTVLYLVVGSCKLQERHEDRGDTLAFTKVTAQ